MPLNYGRIEELLISFKSREETIAPVQEVKFTHVVHCECGIDVHQQRIIATVRHSDQNSETREYETFTSSLTELREWCKAEGVTHIAMESTGIYWKPVFNVLEEDFEIMHFHRDLREPYHI